MRLFAMATAALLFAGAAHAELKVCNNSGVKRSLAIGYTDNGTWTSEGWWNIEAGACATPIKGPIKQRYIYWRATTAGQEFAHEDFMFCVTDVPFTIAGDKDCETRGYQKAGFRVVDTGAEGADFTLDIPPLEAAAAPEAPAAEPDAAPADAPEQPKLSDAPAPLHPPITPEPAPEAAPVRATVLSGPVPAEGEVFVRGQQGEPFTQSALMQECGLTDEGHLCTLYAEGWRYALYEGQTSSEIIDALKGLAPNTPVDIMGDLVYYGDITAEVILSRIAPGPADPKAELRAALQGNWVSTDDPTYTALIIGSEIMQYSAGELTSVSVMNIGTTCGDGVELEGDIFLLQEMGGDPMDGICWSLETVTPDSLTVFYLPRGNILSFRRP